jgi:hypothetical protein
MERDRSFSGRMPKTEGARSSWEGTELSTEVIEEPGERRDEVEVVVLDLERPLNTDRRLGLCESEWARAVDLARTWAACSGGSLEERVDGGSLWPSSSQWPAIMREEWVG